MYIFKKKEKILLIILKIVLNTFKESTYGTHIHEKREERETRFTNLIHTIINRGGRCLIPVFALGRAQELLLILGKINCLIVFFFFEFYIK